MKLVHAMVAGLLALPSSAAAQGCAHTSGYADDMLETFGGTFFSSDPAHVAERGDAIQQLPPNATRTVVHEDSVCDRVIPVAIAYMRQKNGVWGAYQEGDYRATVLRYGPYLAVAISAAVPPASSLRPNTFSVPTSRNGALIVYRARDLERLKVFR